MAKKDALLVLQYECGVCAYSSNLENGGDDATVEQIRKRAKWDIDDYVCRGLILNGMSDPLFDIYQSVKSSKELWDSLEAKYMAKDASSKKFLVSNFTNYRIIDSRPVMEQYNELLGILGRFTQHKMIMDEVIQDSDKPKSNNIVGPSIINGVEHNNSSRYNDNKGKHKYHDNIMVAPNKKAKPTCWKCGKTSHIKRDCEGVNVGNKAMVQAQRVQWMDDDVAWWVESIVTVHVCKDRCWFKTYESLNDGYTLHRGNKSTALVLGRGCVDLRLSIVNDNFASAFMSKDGLIPAFDMDTEKCKTCMLTKITKKPFQNVKRKTKVLELIRSDLCDLVATPSLGNKKYFVTFIDDASRFCYVYLLHTKDEALDKFKVFKTKVELQQGSLIKRFKTDMGVVRLSDPKLKTMGKRGIKCIFVGYDEHSKSFRFYVIEPNKSVLINSIIESRDAIFDENRFSSVPRPSQRSLINGTENFSGSVVPKEVTEEDDPKTFDEAMKSQDVVFWKEAAIFKRKLKVDGTYEKFKARLVIQGFRQKSGINYFDTYAPMACISTIRLLLAMVSIHNLIIHQMDIKTTFLNGELDGDFYMNQPQGFIMTGNENKVKFDVTGKGVIIFLFVDDMLIFGTDQDQVDLTKEFLSSRFSMKDMGEADVILVSTPMDTSKKLMPNNGQSVSQLEYSRVTGCLMYAMTCIRLDIDFVVALAAADKEAEWLKNLLLEIPLWSKPIAGA
ncbi:zinc finger, CCHC-type containing protein [Tanacetum coccineum]|uniref:Zinc finger, CCHC-type containing protein n=1 Tax=Tanacetum coccineum TaxID=301880 RepID=A0ABQ5EAS6_9ASTR